MVVLSDGYLAMDSGGGTGVDAYGYAPPGVQNVCLVALNAFAKNAADQYIGTKRPDENIIYTISHEIGHIMVGLGHPDDGDGVAPLDNTLDRKKRLMCSGKRSNNNSILLVKREWDRADSWLSTKPTGDN